MQNVKVTFNPLKIEGVVPKGITILEAARKVGITIESPCGGTGKCGKDLVQVRTNKVLETVLACKTRIETDLEVIVPSHEKKSIKTVEGFYGEATRVDTINPSTRKEVHHENGVCSTKVFVNGELSFIENGDTTAQSYGIALDIGTTTLVASLVDLNSGETLGSSSTLNPLVYYGHDVMSRIKYSASQQDGLLRMHKDLTSAVNLLIKLLSFEIDVKLENIYQIVAAGNTTMQHIFLNKEIEGIGEYPYKAAILDTYTTAAKELAIHIAEYAPVTTFPCISAYVGGDIVSGLLAIDTNTLDTPALFLDIGTNGELVLLLEDKIVASSTAAGPCFEGMTISCGMRAGEGAIEHVKFGEAVDLEVIGEGQPRGVCGTGLLDAVSELLRVGLVNSRGRLQNPNGSDTVKYKNYLSEKDGKRHFRLTETVSISQEDIRQVQLAKAAIRAGIEILLTTCNSTAYDLKTVIIAGAFGYHLEKESLFRVGILPVLGSANLSFVGNSSLEGAVRMLLNKELLYNAARIARTAQVIELSQFENFEDIFIREMNFNMPTEKSYLTP
ncbi:MAG TPA: ASKHA domain-containing protein [Candidatus Brocadiaceae bacterium]